MSTGLSFDKDVFISYAHVDNETLTPEETGWISAFDRALQRRVTQLLGRKADIWRDDRLQRNDIFAAEIVEQFPRLRVFISIISPRYLQSDWCLKELRAFYESVQASGVVEAGNKSRIFKIVKTPVPATEHPPEIASSLGYKFYQVTENERFREFVLRSGSPTYDQFIERFEDVAQDICQSITALDNGIAMTAKPGADPIPAKCVYLATTTSDLVPTRDNIRRDLEKRGYAVFPDQQLPEDSQFRTAVAAALGQCKLAVHLISEKYGQVPEDETLSMIEMQHGLSQAAALNRLIWLAEPGLDSDDKRQQDFLAQLHNHAVAQPDTELLSGNVEDLKTVIMDTLEQLAAPVEAPSLPPAEGDISRIYLMFDESDRDAVTALDDYLYDQGFEILQPLFDGDEGDMRDAHQSNLKVCDGVLIYCNLAAEAWLKFKMNDLRKAPAYRAGQALIANAVYLDGESSHFKERFRTREATVVKNSGEFSSTDLAPFIALLQNGRSGQ